MRRDLVDRLTPLLEPKKESYREIIEKTILVHDIMMREEITAELEKEFDNRVKIAAFNMVEGLKIALGGGKDE